MSLHYSYDQHEGECYGGNAIDSERGIFCFYATRTWRV